MKRLLTTTALGMLLVASPALAQTSQDSTSPAAPQVEQSQPDTSAPPAATPSTEPPAASDSGSDMTRPEATAPDTAQTDDASKPDMAKSGDAMSSDKTALLPSDVQASNLIGVAVENASGETIGEINDILLSEDGSAKSALVGVGGFLGLGQKNVAIDFSELDVKRDDGNNLTITVAMSAESLEAMPAYKDPNAPAATTTGAAKNQDQAPAGGMTSPSAPKTGSE